jgi:Rad3-related DNA helicase
MTTMKRVLESVTELLPDGGESRDGQLAMADSIYALLADVSANMAPEDEPPPAEALGPQVAIIEAGTGTGKSLAYLVPILAANQRAVVATATIALQGQLVDKDVPTVAKGLGRPVTAAVLKGRSNYLCNQQLKELRQASRSEQLDLLDGRDPDHGLGRRHDHWRPRRARRRPAGRSMAGGQRRRR